MMGDRMKMAVAQFSVSPCVGDLSAEPSPRGEGTVADSFKKFGCCLRGVRGCWIVRRENVMRN